MNVCECKPAPSSCGCGEKMPSPSAEAGLVLTMATVPMQPWEMLYDPSSALKQGTIFPGLDKPFYWMGGGKRG
ncbi:MAG: spore coat associated protein CotJA [Clostridiales bacterium]|nr:spore coat associated protein CotJA [Clostridiales bacterium]MCD8225102.1 spore coat associated protein CotJA [Clostridiales bacterium]